jgi:hypothetical protein
MDNMEQLLETCGKETLLQFVSVSDTDADTPTYELTTSAITYKFKLSDKQTPHYEPYNKSNNYMMLKIQAKDAINAEYVFIFPHNEWGSDVLAVKNASNVKVIEYNASACEVELVPSSGSEWNVYWVINTYEIEKEVRKKLVIKPLKDAWGEDLETLTQDNSDSRYVITMPAWMYQRQDDTKPPFFNIIQAKLAINQTPYVWRIFNGSRRYSFVALGYWIAMFNRKNNTPIALILNINASAPTITNYRPDVPPPTEKRSKKGEKKTPREESSLHEESTSPKDMSAREALLEAAKQAMPQLFENATELIEAAKQAMPQLFENATERVRLKNVLRCDETTITAPTKLPNPGNECFINAAIQCLFASVSFVTNAWSSTDNEFAHADTDTDADTSRKQVYQILHKAFVNVMRQYFCRDKVNLKALKDLTMITRGIIAGRGGDRKMYLINYQGDLTEVIYTITYLFNWIIPPLATISHVNTLNTIPVELPEKRKENDINRSLPAGLVLNGQPYMIFLITRTNLNRRKNVRSLKILEEWICQGRRFRLVSYALHLGNSAGGGHYVCITRCVPKLNNGDDFFQPQNIDWTCCNDGTITTPAPQKYHPANIFAKRNVVVLVYEAQ